MTKSPFVSLEILFVISDGDVLYILYYIVVVEALCYVFYSMHLFFIIEHVSWTYVPCMILDWVYAMIGCVRMLYFIFIIIIVMYSV